MREKIRTPDTLVRSQVLYPAELHAHIAFNGNELMLHIITGIVKSQVLITIPAEISINFKHHSGRQRSVPNITQEGYDHKAGARVSTDHGSGIADQDILISLFPKHLFHISRILGNIAVTYHDHILVIFILT